MAMFGNRRPYVRSSVSVILLLCCVTLPAKSAVRIVGPRQLVDLNGTWQVEQGSMETVPSVFHHAVIVPGLMDMAAPAFHGVGKPSKERLAFWYRRTFKIEGPTPDVALLKVNKACFGTRVWLNGQDVGEHLPCFTAGYFDLRPQIKDKGAENELIIRVGANPECLPADMPRGWDFEKYLYIPGIYDSVQLILSGTPFIKNVQVVPDVASRTLRAVVELEAGEQAGEARVTARLREARSGRAVGSADRAILPLAARQPGKTELCMSIPDVRVWSPEDPFLYEMVLETGADSMAVRFGMRSFRFDPASGRAILNGKPYYMRGTNVCIFRFFEDEKRADLPWRADWVRRMHRQFKTLSWNAIRYCIGFPPESWYDIADEEGFLIQDEFPIWLLNPNALKDAAPEFPRAEKIIPEYVEWMRERWNHPCVVIWDGQNESLTDETGKAIRAVRHLDLSNRPWENGWAEPQSPTDCVESHPYLFIRWWQGGRPFRLSEMPGVSAFPRLLETQKKLAVPIIINEYCWLWLNRDGTPTCLTGKVYEGILGRDSTTEARRQIHARYVAALTEFWRCHRRCAGVLHFCGLGYSRHGDKPRPEGGATSDHWIDLENLTFEPLFRKYVGDAFSPVGLMLDFWADEVLAGSRPSLKICVINDLEADWKGMVRLRVLKGHRWVSTQEAGCEVKGFGRKTLSLSHAMPDSPGRYTLAAELESPDGKTVRSLRDVTVVPTGGWP
jgi:hypothetical protein